MNTCVAFVALAGVLLLMLLARGGSARHQGPPRAAGLPGPLIFAPRHRVLEARPKLLLLSPLANEWLHLEVRGGCGNAHVWVKAGEQPWPAALSELVPGQLVVLLCRGLTGVDRCTVERAAARPSALWQRGGAAGAQHWSRYGFPAAALRAAALAGVGSAAEQMRCGLAQTWAWRRGLSEDVGAPADASGISLR